MNINFLIAARKNLPDDEETTFVLYKVGPLWALYKTTYEGESYVFYDEETEPKALFEKLQKKEDWEHEVLNIAIPEETIVKRRCPHCDLKQNFFLDQKTFVCRSCEGIWNFPKSLERGTTPQVVGVILKREER